MKLQQNKKNRTQQSLKLCWQVLKTFKQKSFLGKKVRRLIQIYIQGVPKKSECVALSNRFLEASMTYFSS